MKTARALVALVTTLGPLLAAGTLHAQAPEPPEAAVTPLSRYLDALSSRRLVAAEVGTDRDLALAVETGETLFFAGRAEEAAVVLYEVCESPRFADFAETPSFRGAEYLLASALLELGAVRTSRRYAERILVRGPEDELFVPAFRTYVDGALRVGDIDRAATRLEGLVAEPRPADAASELAYLRGREHYDARRYAEAEPLFALVGRRSRFFTNATYFRGLIAARAQDLAAAEARFCEIASAGEQSRFTFYVDDRYFAVKDLAWLGLGRVAHEGRRADDAFYYYFQVPADSARVAEALFESAYAMYEGDELDTAADLLDQLETRFPESAHTHEATLLRGYIHLARCEFEAAERAFVAFQTRYEPVVEEIDRVLASTSRQRALYDAVATGATVDPGSTFATLLSLLEVDADFHRLHASVALLEAESARAGRLSVDLYAILARLRGEERPVAADAIVAFESELEVIRRRADDARSALRALEQQLDAMRRAGAASATLEPLEAEVRGLSTRITALERRAIDIAPHEAPEANPPARDAEGMIAADARRAAGLPGRVAQTRARAMGVANEVALTSLRTLRETLGAQIRRSRIGRIDAVMGSKRRIEIQIESLAAGRFPAELMDVFRIQGLLREDEEYWPYEGELWTDEMDGTPTSEVEE